jgi:hypothetical protein
VLVERRPGSRRPAAPRLVALTPAAGGERGHPVARGAEAEEFFARLDDADRAALTRILATLLA